MTKPSAFQWEKADKDGRLAAIRDGIGRNLSSSQISVELGTSRSSIIGYIKRARDAGEPWAQSDNIRRAEEARRIERATAAGKAPPKAKTYAKRGGLAPRKPKAFYVPPQSGRGIAERVEKRAADIAKFEAPADPIEEVIERPADIWAPLDGIEPIHLHEMPTSGRCRWPVDGRTGRGVLQCGAPSDPSDRYCRAHMAIAYQPRREKPKPEKK